MGMGTVMMKCIVRDMKVFCHKWWLAGFLIVSAFVQGISGNRLEGCMDKCYRDSCRSQHRSESVGCFGMFTCYNGCKIRDLGLNRRECQYTCANPDLHRSWSEKQLRIQAKVQDHYFILKDYYDYRCYNRYNNDNDKYCSNYPTYAECEIGCAFYDFN